MILDREVMSVARLLGGSAVVAGVLLPWLKFSAITQTGNGLFFGTTHVQRINTQGGMAAGSCAQAGAYRSVPYSADYVFWRAE